MAVTKISDLSIVPEDFKDYVEKLIMERSEMFQSGLVINVPTFIPSKGTMTNAPSFLGFDGDDEVLSDSGSLTVNAVGSLNAVSAINFRGKAYGANDLVDMLAGKDPLGNLASKFADYWVRKLNQTLISTMIGASEGLDAAYGAGTIILDGSAAVLDGDVVIDTKQLAGEYGDALSLFICHSAVKASLQKRDLTKDVVVESVGTSVTTYQGMTVIVDDKLVDAAGVYTSYVAAPGAVAYSEGIDPALAIETDRDILAGDDIVTSRKRYILHPAGSTFKGASVAGVSPTNLELADEDNWGAEDVNEANRVKFRAVKHLV